jgi:predicted nucleic acid-binding protein
LREYYAVSTKGVIFERPLEVKETLLKIEEYMSHFKVLYGNGVSLTILKEIAAKYHIRKKNIHDANIVATMLANRLKSIFTFNIKDFNFYEEIKLFKMDL